MMTEKKYTIDKDLLDYYRKKKLLTLKEFCKKIGIGEGAYHNKNNPNNTSDWGVGEVSKAKEVLNLTTEQAIQIFFDF